MGEGEDLERGWSSFVSFHGRRGGNRGRKWWDVGEMGGIGGEEVDCGPGWPPEKYVSS